MWTLPSGSTSRGISPFRLNTVPELNGDIVKCCGFGRQYLVRPSLLPRLVGRRGPQRFGQAPT